MKVYSLLRKKKIESLVRALGLEKVEGIVADTPDFEYECGVKLFIPSGMDFSIDGIRYGEEDIRAMADQGFTYEQILSHYYTGISIVKM